MSRASALLITSKKEVLHSRTLKTPMTNSDKQRITIIYDDKITLILQLYPSGHKGTECHRESLEIIKNGHNFGHNARI